jgi:TPR repeat protein
LVIFNVVLGESMVSPRKIGTWILDRPLGEGGMGRVFLAHHSVTGAPAALKELSPEIAANEQLQQRFLNEAKTHMGLRHEHIAFVQDFILEAGECAMVVEYLPGGSLADRLEEAQGPLDQRTAIIWVRQALSALDYAHQRGVIHRDIKPQNLMLDDHGKVKVADFGIAMVVGAEKLTRTQSTLGTSHYMSPEQIQDPHGVTHLTDLYSMGLVLYELITGRLPFDGPSDASIMVAQATQPPPPPREINPSIPESLEAIILRSLAKNPGERFGGCAEFAEALEDFEQGLPLAPLRRRTVVEASTTPTTTGKPNVALTGVYPPEANHSKKTKLTIAICTVAILVVGLYVFSDKFELWSKFKTADSSSLPNIAELLKKAESGDPSAQHKLGFALISGKGTEKNITEGINWTVKSANQGYAKAQFNLGNFYQQGTGLTKDEAEGVKWYRKAAEQGLAGAQNNLSICYQQGRGVSKDVTESLRWCRMAADQGLPEAQVRLGFIYEVGNGVPMDETEACRWYRKAADQGQAIGQANLGTMLLNGRGIAKDETEGAKWLRKSSEQGNGVAQAKLGYLYAHGVGVSKDETESFKWRLKAAEQGLSGAQSDIGFMYFNGVGVGKDVAEAAKWFRKAAEQGSVVGQTNLAEMYRTGNGVPRDEVEAEKWRLKAINRNVQRPEF